jgi:serine protease Do
LPNHGQGWIARALAGAGVLWVIFAAQTAAGATVSARLQDAARASTLEVVGTKPANDPLTYEKPLPLELLPFYVRSDAYLPVGTAFCIGPNRYVSAAHVLGAGVASQYGAPKLRDRQGRVYDIDQVLKYSTLEDFAVFSLRNPPKTPALPVNRAPRINQTVYAVGDALGEGIVIRDGLFTSETPEELEGRWNWIRFSAAASPGNSGGPLLDRNGRVIGIVLAKSPNENLNYAAPIARVLDAPEGKGKVEARASFGLSFLPDTIVSEFNEEFPLPASYADFSRQMTGLIDREYDRAKARLLESQAATLFPKGEGSEALLHSQYRTRDPRLILKEDGRWNATEAYMSSTVELPKNGSIDSGMLAGTRVLRLWTPDGVSVGDLFRDSRVYMDLALKGLKFTRTIASQSIKITSLGAAREQSEFVDAWQRKWQLRTWVLPFWDSVAVSLALPVPGGCVSLVRVTPTALEYGTVDEMKMLAGLAYVTYQGTLDNWREFLALKSWQPQAFSKLEIAFEYGKSFRYRSPRLEVELPHDLESITGRSVLALNFSYFRDHGTVVWDVAGIGLLGDEDATTYVDVLRRPRPPGSLGREYQDTWRKLVNREAPYDSIAYPEGRKTLIGTTVTADADSKERIDAAATVLYEIQYAVNARLGQKLMREMEQTILRGTKILER